MICKRNRRPQINGVRIFSISSISHGRKASVNPKLSGIKAISFDVDGTLLDFETVMRSSLSRAIQELESYHPQEAANLSVEGLVATRDRVFSEMRNQTLNLKAIRRESFNQAMQSVRIHDEELVSHVTQVYIDHRFNNLHIFDDVLPTLQALSERYTVGLLSNGNSRPEALGMQNLLQFSIFAEDHGVEKPDPAIFLILLEQTGCSSEEVLHVGDSIQDDVVGAANAGIKSIWLNRNGSEKTTHEATSYEISSLTQLLDILEE